MLVHRKNHKEMSLTVADAGMEAWGDMVDARFVFVTRKFRRSISEGRGRYADRVVAPSQLGRGA